MAKLDVEQGHPGGLTPDPAEWFSRNPTKFVADPLDPNADLRFPHSIPIFDEMRTTDGQVSSLLAAISLPILSARWQLDTEGVRPEIAEFVRTELGLQAPGDSRKRKVKSPVVWAEHLREALLCLPFGFMPFEQVYEAGPPTPEQVAAGVDLPLVYHLRKLAPRLPYTVTQIHVGRDGGLAGISQTPLSSVATFGRDTFIPVSKLVFYCHNREGADWSGRSILRTVYKNWLIGDRLLRLSAQIVERNGMGVPFVTHDPAVVSKADADRLASDIRAGAHAGGSLPVGASVDIKGVTGQTVDALPYMRYQDEKIAESALAMFKTLGHDAGARSLGDTFVDIFLSAVQAVANFFGSVATEHVIRDLVAENFGPDEEYPVLVPGDLSANRAITTTAVKELVDAKIIIPDQKLEEWFRKTNGLPEADLATSRAEAAAAVAAETGESADDLLKRSNVAGTLIRSGFDPEDAMRSAGLDPVKHLGLLPVTLQPPAAGTDLENAVAPVVEPGAAPAPAAPVGLAEHDGETIGRLTLLLEETIAIRKRQTSSV